MCCLFGGPPKVCVLIEPTNKSRYQGPALVAGWEGEKMQGQGEMAAVSSQFAFGVNQDLQAGVRELAPGEQKVIIESWKNDAGELSRREAESGVVKRASKPVGRRKKKWSHLPNNQKVAQKKEVKKH